MLFEYQAVPKTALINKGTGAGGANTTRNGKMFEKKMDNQTRMFNDGWSKTYFKKKSDKVGDYCLTKTYPDKTVVCVVQGGFKKYMKLKYNVDVFRSPDEAYIIQYPTGNSVVKIVEKKQQHVEGSVETKLWSGPSLKREYELVLGSAFNVQYGFCVCEFLQHKLVSEQKKYMVLNKILHDANIAVLFGDDDGYFDTLDKWLNSSL